MAFIGIRLGRRMKISWYHGTFFLWENPSKLCGAPSIRKRTTNAGWQKYSIARSGGHTLGWWLKKSLSRRGLAQRLISIEMRLDPAPKPLGIEYDAMLRIVVSHPRQRFSKPLLQHRIKIGSGREHAVIIRW